MAPALPGMPGLPSPPVEPLGPPLSTLGGVTLVRGSPAMPAVPSLPMSAKPPAPPLERQRLGPAHDPPFCVAGAPVHFADAPCCCGSALVPSAPFPPSAPACPGAPLPAAIFTRRKLTFIDASTIAPMLLAPAVVASGAIVNA